MTAARKPACEHCRAATIFVGDCRLCLRCCLSRCVHTHDCFLRCLGCGAQAEKNADYCGGTECRADAAPTASGDEPDDYCGEGEKRDDGVPDEDDEEDDAYGY